MLTAEEFIEAVALRQLVPESLLSRLRQKVRGSSGVLSGAAAARFLVEAGALTQEQADEVLNSPFGEALLAPDDEELFSVVADEDDLPAALSDEVAPEVEYLDSEGLDADASAASEDAPAARSTRRRHLKKAKANEFDSPLFLLGGGGLALLLLVGGALVFLIGKESGDEVFRTAQESYETASYQQAIARFEKFVADYPTHAEHSAARVRLSVARIRQALDTARDPALALEIAATETPLIEDEEAFSEARGELAALLPQIAQLLAEKADAASRSGDSASAATAAKGAEQALAMIANTKYVPKSLREESELSAIRALLTRVELRAEALEALSKVIERIESASGGGEIRDAFAAHAEFVRAYPQLASEPKLIAALGVVAEAERVAAKFTAEPIPAETGAAASSVSRTIAVVDRTLAGEIDAPGLMVSVHNGFAYAVEAGTGSLRWRRPIGVEVTPSQPIASGDAWLLVDDRRRELVAVDAQTGEDRWRAPLPGPGSTPLIAGKRVLMTTEAGSLLAFEAASGQREGAVVFAQPLRTPPSRDPVTGRLYVLGESASLYTLDADSLDCLAVTVTGHAAASIAVPPAVIERTLSLIENIGYQTAELRVYRLGDGGLPGELLAQERLEGAVTAPPVVAGRRLVVATDRGEVSIFEITSNADNVQVNRVAKRSPGRDATATQSIAYAEGALWIAEERLQKSLASLAENRLVVERLPEDFSGDRFVGPLVVNGKALLHARRLKDRDAVALAATDMTTGKPVWQTEVAAPPLMTPQTLARPAGVMTVSKSGAVYLIDRDAISAGVIDRATATAPARRGLSERYTQLTSLGGGRLVISNPQQDLYLAVALSPRPQAATIRLPETLATAPTALGQGWLAPLEIGQVLYLDQAGRNLATPFQPTLRPGQPIAWVAPAAGTVDGTAVAVIADGVEMVYGLRVSADGAALELAGSHRLEGAQPTGPITLVGRRVLVGLSAGRMALYEEPALGEPHFIEIGAPTVWGPFAVGENDSTLALLATAPQQDRASELVLLDTAGEGRVVWRQTLSDGMPLGEPLTEGPGVLVATDRGVLRRYSLNEGETLARVDLGQTLGSGPSRSGSRLLICAADGALLVVSSP
ncbi:outer membrane protein assembly factor BamB family protein [Botrimarina hoheduenensis]|uniref:Outer membrane biogenesis protein BamB n=1 Tax=Botrimarina hoheduenensis TaxID=2528000 RepID=A0A5C5VXX4_9BACT|nr:PQQ-binding-like beta-propeller repeat protein [Botrimarina hoheduenensis]TWT42569.1 outer membrane biogenesis protein BamB [Botrimarina hoheduenensis]